MRESDTKHIQYFTILVLAEIAYAAGIILTYTAAYSPISAGNVAQSSNVYAPPYLLYLIVSIAVLAILVRLKKDFMAKMFGKYFGIIIGYQIFLSVFLIILYISAFLYPSESLSVTLLGAGLLASVGVIVWYKVRRLHNTFAILIGAIAIAVFATSFSTFWLFVIFALMSVWDIIAVFKLRFMQALASMAVSGDGKRMYPLFLYSGPVQGLRDKLNGTSRENKAALLGLGDIIIPGACAASAVVYMHASIVLIFPLLLFGLVLDMFWAKKMNKGVPALPILFVLLFIGVFLL